MRLIPPPTYVCEFLLKALRYRSALPSIQYRFVQSISTLCVYFFHHHQSSHVVPATIHQNIMFYVWDGLLKLSLKNHSIKCQIFTASSVLNNLVRSAKTYSKWSIVKHILKRNQNWHCVVRKPDSARSRATTITGAKSPKYAKPAHELLDCSALWGFVWL